jgi:hypothetical protein
VVPQVAHDTAEAVAQLILHAGRCAPGHRRPRRRSAPVRAVVRSARRHDRAGNNRLRSAGSSTSGG